MHERQLAQVLRSKACRQRIRCAHVFYCFRTEPLPHRAVLCVPPLHGPASTHVPGGQPLVGFRGQHLGADNRPGSNILPRLTLACVRWRNGLKIVGIVVGSLIETCLRSSRCAESRGTPHGTLPIGGTRAERPQPRRKNALGTCAHRVHTAAATSAARSRRAGPHTSLGHVNPFYVRPREPEERSDRAARSLLTRAQEFQNHHCAQQVRWAMRLDDAAAGEWRAMAPAVLRLR